MNPLVLPWLAEKPWWKVAAFNFVIQVFTAYLVFPIAIGIVSAPNRVVFADSFFMGTLILWAALLFLTSALFLSLTGFLFWVGCWTRSAIGKSVFLTLTWSATTILIVALTGVLFLNH